MSFEKPTKEELDESKIERDTSTFKKMNIAVTIEGLFVDDSDLEKNETEEFNQKVDELGEVLTLEHNISIDDIDSAHMADVKIGPASTKKLNELIRLSDKIRNGQINNRYSSK